MKPRSNRSPSCLTRNRYSFCLRIKVPKDLQQMIGKKELRYSLKTVIDGVADQKSQFLAARMRRFFKFLRKGGSQLTVLSDDQIQKPVNQYIKDSIDRLDDFFDGEADDESKPYGDAPVAYSNITFTEQVGNKLNRGPKKDLKKQRLKETA